MRLAISAVLRLVAGDYCAIHDDFFWPGWLNVNEPQVSPSIMLSSQQESAIAAIFD
jgi:hypothetical protein